MPATALRSDMGTESDHAARSTATTSPRCRTPTSEEILAADFLCSHPDGSLVDRPTFLAQTARPVAIRDLAAEDVVVRLMGDFAIIHAATRYLKPDGAQGRGRYTDVWARRGGRWLCVSAHATRC